MNTVQERWKCKHQKILQTMKVQISCLVDIWKIARKPKWWIFDVELLKVCVETYTSEKIEAVDCGFEDTLDWQSKESGKQAGSSVLNSCAPASLPVWWLQNLTNAFYTFTFQISHKWSYRWILKWNHRKKKYSKTGLITQVTKHNLGEPILHFIVQ